MSQRWYAIRAKGVRAADEPKEAEVFIFGDIGMSWWGESVVASDFVKEFAAIDADKITVRINSVGGSVHDGVAIHNAIKRHKATVTTSIEGVAYSIASLIAMAGDTIEMAENALFMIHAPATGTWGNAVQHRENADMLDMYAKAMSASYVAKTGKSGDEIMALLTDGADHYYTAQEAKDAGFVDEIVGALPLAASGRDLVSAHARYRSTPKAEPAAPQASATPAAPAAPQSKENPMPGAVTNPQAEPKSQAEVLAADKARREAIRAEFAPFAHIDAVTALRQGCEDDVECTAEAAAKKILAVMAKDVTPVGATHIQTVADERDKRIEAQAVALMVRAGVADDKVRQAAARSPFRGHRLMDLARASLERAGVSTAGMDQMQIVGAAFTQTGSDFPILLENAMHKTLLASWAIAPDTWARFCARGSVSDFRDHPRYRVGSLGNLDELDEVGEFRNKAIPDGERAKIRAGTKGNIINLSRQAIVNDDLGAFIGLAAMLGRSAKRTIEADVYKMLALNGGLGPALEDGKTLFHADHGNIGTGAVLSVESIDADRVKMGSQMDVGGNDFLDLEPAVLLVPNSLGGQARVINDAQYDPDTANKLQRPNMVRGLFRDIVDTARLTGTRRYMFADPNVAPVLEVAFLDGADTPFLEMEQGFTVDGSRWKVRLDYGVAGVDYRGAVTNAGTGD